MQTSVFEHMANLVLVRDLQSKLGPKLNYYQKLPEIEEILRENSIEEDYNPLDRISLVFKDGKVIGWLAYDSFFDCDQPLMECLDEIQPSSLMSGATTALASIRIFHNTSQPFFFVLENNSITGTLMYEDFFNLPFKLCLLSLVLHLEDCALKILHQNAKESWNVLPHQRKKKSEEVYTKRYGYKADSDKVPYDKLLECTMFCDKGKILGKRSLLGDVSKGKISSIFTGAERIRNACAHTRSEDEQFHQIIKREKLKLFIDDIQMLTQKIENSMENQAVHFT